MITVTDSYINHMKLNVCEKLFIQKFPYIDISDAFYYERHNEICNEVYFSEYSQNIHDNNSNSYYEQTINFDSNISLS